MDTELIHDFQSTVIEEGYGPKTMVLNTIDNSKISNYFLNQKHKYCGTKIPNDYYVNANSVVGKFHSDSTKESEGFQITATYMKGEF